MSLPPPFFPPNLAAFFLSFFSFFFFFGPCSAQFAFCLQQFFFRVLSCKGASLPSYFWEFIGPRFIELLQSFLCTCSHQLLQCIRPNIFSCCFQWACQTGKFLVSTCCLFWDAQVSQMLRCFPLLPGAGAMQV